MKYEILDDGIIKISLDNGKANPVSLDLANDLMAALNKAQQDGKGVLLCGNPGIFSAGFDLKVIAQGMDKANAMLQAGFLMTQALYKHPQPVVIACEGHAIGMGVFMLLAADYRVGAQGKFAIQLPETSIGMHFTEILKIIAKAHIAPHHHSRAIVQSRPYAPDEAAQIGMLDETVAPEEVQKVATLRLKELCALPADKYAENKLHVRASEINAIRESLQ